MTSEAPLPGSGVLSGGGVAAIVVVLILLLLLGAGIVIISVISWRKRRGKTPEEYTYPVQTLQITQTGAAFGQYSMTATVIMS